METFPVRKSIRWKLFQKLLKKWCPFQATFQWMVTYTPGIESNWWAESHLFFKENSILGKDENADRSGGTLMFCSSGHTFCREIEYSPEPAFLPTYLLSKGNFFSVISSTNILDIYRKKEGAVRGKVIAEKYFTFFSIMML